MCRRFQSRCVGSLVLSLVVAWPAIGSATPDFPAVVVQSLSLSGITIDPPQGCKLCHPTDAGGTSLSPFGTLVRQDGASPYDEGSLKQALAEVGLDAPNLIDDIKAGRDPNADTSTADVHAPEYGCGLVMGSPAAPPTMPALASVALLAAIRRRARRSEPSETPKH